MLRYLLGISQLSSERQHALYPLRCILSVRADNCCVMQAHIGTSLLAASFMLLDNTGELYCLEAAISRHQIAVNAQFCG